MLASKLWGEFAFGFWFMVSMMIVAFIVMVVPSFLPSPEKARLPVYRPRYALASAGGAIVIAILMFFPQITPANVAFTEPLWRIVGWTLLILFIIGAGLGLSGAGVESRPGGTVLEERCARLLVCVACFRPCRVCGMADPAPQESGTGKHHIARAHMARVPAPALAAPRRVSLRRLNALYVHPVIERLNHPQQMSRR